MGFLLSVLTLQKSSEDINEFSFHEKIPHSFNYIVVSASWQKHMIDSLFKKRV